MLRGAVDYGQSAHLVERDPGGIGTLCPCVWIFVPAVRDEEAADGFSISNSQKKPLGQHCCHPSAIFRVLTVHLSKVTLMATPDDLVLTVEQTVNQARERNVFGS